MKAAPGQKPASWANASSVYWDPFEATVSVFPSQTDTRVTLSAMEMALGHHKEGTFGYNLLVLAL